MFLYFICSLKSTETIISGLYYHSKYNSFENFPFGSLPLCINQPYLFPIGNNNDNHINKCNVHLFLPSKNQSDNYQNWCSFNLTEDNRSEIEDLLGEKTSLVFKAGKSYSSVPLGPSNSTIYTDFQFTLAGNDNNFDLFSIQPSNAVNIKADSLTFTYSFFFTEPISNPMIHQTIIRFFIGIFAILLIILIIILQPQIIHEPDPISVPIIPQNTYVYVEFVGAGIGVLFSFFTYLYFDYTNIDWKTSYIYGCLIPFFISAVSSSLVTSITCSIWRVKDIGSALYFMPLIFPSILLAIIFSFIWIPLSIGACVSISLRSIFFLIFTVIFIKLPVNLFVSIIISHIYTPPPYHSYMNINMIKFTHSKMVFSIFSNALVFLVLYPPFQGTFTSFLNDYSIKTWQTVLLFIPLWMLACFCSGIASIPHCDEANWASGTFSSSAGSGIVIWLVTNVNECFVKHRTSFLQQIKFSSITAIVCIAIALSSGGLSVLSALWWIMKRGSPAKNA